MEDGLLSAFGPPILAFERMVLGIEIPRSDKQGGGEDVINQDEVTVRSTL